MKKAIIFYVIIIITIVSVFAVKNNKYINRINKYIVKNSEESIIEGIKRFATIRPNVEITVRKIVSIDNKLFVVFTAGDVMGETVLTLKRLGRYKIEYIGWGSFISYGILETDKGKYYVINGKRSDSQISHVTSSIDGEVYRMYIPNEDYFIIYTSLAQETEKEFPDDFKIFDKNDTDITYEMIKKYSNTNIKQLLKKLKRSNDID